MPCELISIAGGWAGAALVADVAQESADKSLSAKWFDGPTRVCTTLLLPGQTTELVENAAPVSPGTIEHVFDAFHDSVRAAEVVLFMGSLPKDIDRNFFADLARCVGQSDLPVVADIRGDELKALLPFRPRVVKPNRAELAATVGKSLDDDTALSAAISEIQRRGAQAVVVTDGPNAVWVAAGALLQRLHVDALPFPRNPIGCGDCLAAGVAVGLAQGQHLVEAVECGMALARANAETLLPVRGLNWPTKAANPND